MKDILFHILSVAYAATFVIGIIGYRPTIKDLYHRKPSANIPSYIIWTMTGGITLLYSIFILPDILFILVSASHFLACAIILILALRTRKK